METHETHISGAWPGSLRVQRAEETQGRGPMPQAGQCLGLQAFQEKQCGLSHRPELSPSSCGIPGTSLHLCTTVPSSVE